MEWPTASKKRRRSRLPGGSDERKPNVSGAAHVSKPQSTAERRELRTCYGAICNFISEWGDDIARVNSEKFMAIMDEVDQMHKQVKKPREQVSDAEALLGLADTLKSSVMYLSDGGITPTNFVSCLLENFGQQGTTGTDGEAKKHMLWKKIGHQVSPIFSNGIGCCTMLGPMMKYELKQRKVAVYKKRTEQSTKARPKELKRAVKEMIDTDKNMLTMFQILLQHKTVKLENLLLNRNSFAQTVENLFALSFLAKDGRVLIAVDEKGSHIVSPRNAPSAAAVISREVVYTHFIFRLDFCDWMLMKALVPEGHELMPNRNGVKLSGEYVPKIYQSSSSGPSSSQAATPLTQYLGNRGAMLQHNREERRAGEEKNLICKCWLQL